MLPHIKPQVTAVAHVAKTLFQIITGRVLTQVGGGKNDDAFGPLRFLPMAFFTAARTGVRLMQPAFARALATV